jgi:hypothetical protein
MALRLFQALQSHPSTCEELERQLDLKHQTASARLSELRTAGCIRPTGQTRPSSSLTDSDVYETVPGATFAHYEAWRTQNGRTARVDTAQLVRAAQAYAAARHDHAPAEVWRPLAQQLLEAAQQTFPNG